MPLKTVRFTQRDKSEDFLPTVRKRVNEYFESNNISRYANASMVFKTIFMISLYLVPYFLLITGVITNYWVVYAMWILMGLGMSGIGLSVMHDANHGAYSNKPIVNKIMGSLMYLIGGNPVNWRIQHNVLHHSFTNIEGMDEDINTGVVLRFSPHQKVYWMHRFQHIYAWPLYGLMTILWSTTKDFKQLFRYKRLDLHKTQNRTFYSLLVEIATSKILYYAVFFVIPMIFIPAPWYLILAGFISMHLVTGLVLACVFQPAHVMPTMDFPLPDEKGNIDNNWAIHELMTTTNFAPTNRLLSWYVGGLNYQIEHHLFPNVCHIHYRKISSIVKSTAEEFSLPYYSEPTFRGAIYKHAMMLKHLGRQEQPAFA